jgi:peptidoglycan/xylan/chitin deacetylase (PgdA/CDA1 family)
MHINFRNKMIGGILIFSFLLSGVLTASGFSFFKKAESISKGIVVPIVMYHEVKPYKTRKDVITPYEIESDLKYLRANNYTAITMTDLIDYVNGGKELPGKPIILSFDDGYYNNYAYVYPLLKKYNMKIVLSLIGKYTDDATQIPEDNLNYSHVTWDQINDMKSSGLVEIQNHTYDLHTITRKRYGCQKNKGESLTHYEQVLTEDIGKLQEEITAMTGSTPNTFTYPYGQVSKGSYPIVKKLGFKASLTCDYGVNIVTRDPEMLYGLKRVCRAHGVPIQKALRDVMKTLKFR